MEFSVNGANYRCSKLSVFDQLKVSRKLLPVLAGLTSELQSLRESAAPGQALETLLPKIAQSLAGMSDDDCNAILYPCLSVVSRQHQKGWTPVFSQGQMMFDDINLVSMLQIVSKVVGDSLGNFFQELPADVTSTL
ncbi:hypothetical protein NXJ56_001013 [Salmonella enterica]|nr:hypothetical protein [Salmonella enterica]EJR6244217.1 hypothetical protein [Salmonella enterica]